MQRAHLEIVDASTCCVSCSMAIKLTRECHNEEMVCNASTSFTCGMEGKVEATEGGYQDKTCLRWQENTSLVFLENTSFLLWLLQQTCSRRYLMEKSNSKETTEISADNSVPE